MMIQYSKVQYSASKDGAFLPVADAVRKAVS